MIPEFIAERFERKEFYGEFIAGVMFVDISGFTSMTQKLMEKGKEGVEVLTDAMNFIFSPSIKSIMQNRGFVSSFAGDAFTAIFPMDKSNLAHFLSSAFEINKIFKSKKKFVSDFAEFEIRVKISLSFGSVRWNIIKGAEYYTYFFDGNAISEVAKNEKYSVKDRIICDRELFAKVKNVVKYKQKSEDLFELQEFYLSEKLKKEYRLQKPSKKTLSKFIHREILSLREIGEFRKVITCFISIKKDKHFIETLVRIMGLTDFYKGYFNKIDFGDKGYVVMIIFGAPIIPDNVFKRASEFALKVKNLKKADKKIGISFGITYSGFIGSEYRKEYTSIGMAVNLAARLMVEAKKNTILTEKNFMENLVNNYEFDFVGSKLLKGFSKKIKTYRLLKKLKTIKSKLKLIFIDREKETGFIKKIIGRVTEKRQPEILYLKGREGVGKTTLINHLKIKYGKSVNWRIFFCDTIVKKAFNPFRNDLKEYFSISDDKDIEENFIEFNIKFEELKRRIEEEAFLLKYEELKEAIGFFLGFNYPNLQKLPNEVLHKKIVLSVSELYCILLKKGVLVIEDSDFIDEESLEVINNMVNICENNALLFIFTYYEHKPDISTYLKSSELQIEPFGKKELHNLIITILKAKGYNLKYIPKSTLNIIYEKTEGVPLFVEQTIFYLLENNLLDKDGNIIIKEFDIPSDISLLVISKIDKFEPEFKKITKVASVLGKKFSDTLLNGVVKEKNLRKYILNGEKEDIWQSITNLDHIFKSSLIRDSVYELILKKELLKLHKNVALTIKKLYKDKQEQFYPDIAYNYHKAKKLYYAAMFYKKAANYSLKRFELSDAIKYLKELYKIDKNLKTLFKLIDVLILKGKTKETKKYLSMLLPEKMNDKEKDYFYLLKAKYLVLIQDYDELEKFINTIMEKITQKRIRNAISIYLLDAYRALKQDEKFKSLAEKLEKTFSKTGMNYAKLLNNIGIYFLEKANYKKAEDYFKRYLKISQKRQDKVSEMKALHNLGIIRSRTGDRKVALEIFTKTLELSLKLQEENTSVKLLSDIAAIYSINNEVTKAIKLYKKAIKLNGIAQNRFQRGILYYNLAEAYFRVQDFQKAVENLNKSIEICRTINDKTGITFAYDLLGDILFTQSKYEEAKNIYLKNLKLQKQIKDTEGIAHTFGNLGNLYKVKGDYKEAEKYYKKQISMLSEVGDKEGEGKAWFNWAMVEMERNNLKSAKEKLKKAIKLFDECSFKYGYNLAKEQFKKIEKSGE